MSSKIIDPLSLGLDESAEDSENTRSVSVWEHGARSRPQIPLKVLKGHAGGLTSCHFCFNDSKMLTSSQDKTAIIWDADSCSKQRVFEGGHQSTISECALVPGKNSIITVSWDKSMICWDVETGQKLWQSSHAGLLTSCSVSADEKLVVCAADAENALYISDANTGQKIHHITDHHASIVTRCRFDSQGQHVASVSADRTVRLWDLLAQKTTISINSNHSNVVSNCCFTSDGRLLCTASWDKTLRLWDIQTGGFRSGGGLTLSKGHAGSVSSCCFSSDGRLLLSGSYDRTAILWDMNTHCHTLTLKGHGDWVTDVSISTDRKWVASASKDCTVRLWNIERSEEIPEIIEKRRDQGMGFHVIKCEECGKPFSVSRLETTDLITKCVFCRLKSPNSYTTQPPIC